MATQLAHATSRAQETGTITVTANAIQFVNGPDVIARKAFDIEFFRITGHAAFEGDVYSYGMMRAAGGFTLGNQTTIITPDGVLRNVTLEGKSVRSDGDRMRGLNADAVDGYSVGAYVPMGGEPVTPTGYIELTQGDRTFKILVVEE